MNEPSGGTSANTRKYVATLPGSGNASAPGNVANVAQATGGLLPQSTLEATASSLQRLRDPESEDERAIAGDRGDLVFVVTGHGTDYKTGKLKNPAAPSFIAAMANMPEPQP